MAVDLPRVSIGIPVRNGQRYLREAMDSLLAQSMSDLEIIICDNASTDGTEQIGREYAARDPRVRYHRNAQDIGPANNHNLCFEMSRGQYFRWHAHDDVVAPDHLEKCVAALEQDQSAVLGYPQTLVIDGKSQPLENYDFKLQTDSASPSRRFAELVLVNHRRHRAVEIFGLIRAAVLRRTPLQGSYARGDSVLLARLALLGRFIEVPGRLFLSRTHTSQSMQMVATHLKNGRSRLSKYLGTGPMPPPEWWNSARKGKVSFPEWNLLREYWASVGPAPLSVLDRVKCHWVMLKWLVFNLPKLTRDVLFALELTISRLFGSRRPDSDAQAACDPCTTGHER
jgi:glycosyltransferase involved in cell wall biosynthesis